MAATKVSLSNKINHLFQVKFNSLGTNDITHLNSKIVDSKIIHNGIPSNYSEEVNQSMQSFSGILLVSVPGLYQTLYS